jgi:hypothetical protein
MEKLVDLHIKEGPLKDYHLNHMQYAYLKRKSTETTLHDLIYMIAGSVAQEEFALGVLELLTTHLLNRWMTRRGIMVSVQL